MIRFRLHRGTAIQWAETNPILEAGEQGFETDTGTYKIGNGLTKWNDLEGYLSEAAMLLAIKNLVEEVVDDSDAHAELVTHIDSLLPHPVYDEGPSLFLLYENAKV